MTLPEQNVPTRACFVPESKDFMDSPGYAGKGSPVLRAGTWVRPYERSGSLSLQFVTLDGGPARPADKKIKNFEKNP